MHNKRLSKTLIFIVSFCLCAMIFISAVAAEPFDISTLTSDFAVLIDADTGKVLIEKDANTVSYPASTTKVMTCIIVLENASDLNQTITAGSEVTGFSKENSLMGIKKGEELRIIDLLYGMMLVSGNDAAEMLAIGVAGSIEGFAELMNAKAADLGLSNTHFVNPNGLHDDAHYTSAYDLAKLSQYAMQNDTFRKIVSTKSYTVAASNKRKDPLELVNTNRFINDKESNKDYNWSAITGVKTGSTNKAQGCLVTSATENGINLISVILRDTSKDNVKRWDESRAMLEYCFKNLDRLDLSTLNLSLPDADASIHISNASRKDEFEGELKLALDNTETVITGFKNDLDAITNDPQSLNIVCTLRNDEISAPIKQGQILGTAAIKHNDETLAVVNIVASRDVLSIEDDPQNPVTSLIKGVVDSPNSKLPPVLIIIAVLLVLAVILSIVMVKGKFRHRSRRLSTPSSKRKHANRNFYNYKK